MIYGTPTQSYVAATIYDAVVLSDSGYSTSSTVITDLNAITNDGSFIFEIILTTGDTAPGSTKSFTLNYGCCSQVLDLDGNPSSKLVNVKSSQAITLDNSATSFLVYQSAPFNLSTQYLYTWFDLDSLDSDATLTVTINLIAINNRTIVSD